MSLTKIIQYGKDIKYAIQNFETGFQRKDVVEGYFVNNNSGNNQRLMYEGMLDVGFKQTYWQIVFPGQTAGLIRKMKPSINGMDEIHVRFYNDGIISAELEYGRFSPGHWRMSREDGNLNLIEILNNEIENVSDEKKAQICSQIAHRDYSAVDQNEFQMPNLSSIAATAFLAIQYPLTTAGAIYLISQGEFYYALEPGLISAIETIGIIGALLSDDKNPTGTAPSNF